MTSPKKPWDDNLFRARQELVAKCRLSSAPWPDGIDSKWDRWYDPTHWEDDGTYIGPEVVSKRMDDSVSNANKIDDVTANKRKEYQRELMRKRRAAEKALKDESK